MPSTNNTDSVIITPTYPYSGSKETNKSLSPALQYNLKQKQNDTTESIPFKNREDSLLPNKYKPSSNFNLFKPIKFSLVFSNKDLPKTSGDSETNKDRFQTVRDSETDNKKMSFKTEKRGKDGKVTKNNKNNLKTFLFRK